MYIIVSLSEDYHPKRAERGGRLFLTLSLSSADSALALWLLLALRRLYLNTSQFWVDEDTTTILTRDNLLVHLDIELALRWNLVEATATCITLHVNDTQTVAGTITDALEALEQTWLNLLLILGAAVATLTTYIVIHIVMPLMIRDTRKAGTLILQGMMFQGVLDDEMKQLIRKAFQKAIRKIKRK